MSSILKQSFAKASSLGEITLRVVLISIFLTLILAAANTYLALKIGMLTSASIPAAIMAMAILRLLKSSNIIEINLIQTAASAGEAVAGGIVYTIPALIIIHYVSNFSYVENFLVAITGGLLGVFFSVPIRRALVSQKALPFPEGVAIAEVIKLSNANKISIKPMLKGMTIGAIFEFLQTGPQLLTTQLQKTILLGKSYLFSVGAGFSSALIGAGYLIGFRVGLSLMIGSCLNYLIILPILSHYQFASAHLILSSSYDNLLMQIKYIGLGGMLTAGALTLIGVVRTFLLKSLHLGMQGVSDFEKHPRHSLVELDLKPKTVLTGIFLLSIVAYFAFQRILPLEAFPFAQQHYILLSVITIIFVLVVGFIAAALCGYFSGLVGVTASPGSAIILGGVILAAVLLQIFLHLIGANLHDSAVQHFAAAVVIVACSVVTGVACIANDNIQDLKVGHIIGATPRNQQLLLMLGVVVASLIIPILMETLYRVYGIAGVMPHAGMSASQSLAAPQAAMLATISQTIFAHELPYSMLFSGALLSLLLGGLNLFLPKKYKFSLLSIAMGMYFPMDTTVPLFIGALLSIIFKSEGEHSHHKRILLACGMVCGAAVLDVLLAFPFAITGNPDLLKITALSHGVLPIVLAVGSVLYIAKQFKR